MNKKTIDMVNLKKKKGTRPPLFGCRENKNHETVSTIGSKISNTLLSVTFNLSNQTESNKNLRNKSMLAT